MWVEAVKYHVFTAMLFQNPILEQLQICFTSCPMCLYKVQKNYDAISSVAKNFLTAFDAVVNLEGRR